MVTKESDIQWVPLPGNIRDGIREKARRRGTLNSKTLIKGEGNEAGFAGEALLRIFAPWLIDDTTNLNWDFRTPNGLTIDVKAKGNCKHTPELNFDCTVPQYQVNHQDCEIYVFTRIAHDMSGGWLLGFIKKSKFADIAVPRFAGSRYNNAGRTTIGNHLVVPIASLLPMSLFHEIKAALPSPRSGAP